MEAAAIAKSATAFKSHFSDGFVPEGYLIYGCSRNQNSTFSSKHIQPEDIANDGDDYVLNKTLKKNTSVQPKL